MFVWHKRLKVCKRELRKYIKSEVKVWKVIHVGGPSGENKIEHNLEWPYIPVYTYRKDVFLKKIKVEKYNKISV